MIAFARQASRPAHHGDTAKLAKVLADTARFVDFGRARRQIVQIDFRVAGYEKIEPAIAVIISEGRACAPAFSRYAELFGYIGEGTVAIIVIETRHTEITDIDIWPTVVIIIANGHSHPPSLICHSGLVSHIFKFPIAQISI